MNPGPPCPRCGADARKMRLPWDEELLLWLLAEGFCLILLALSFFFGRFWWVFTAVISVLLIWVEVKRPKKYRCQACEHQFLHPPVYKDDVQSSSALKQDRDKHPTP